MLGVGEAFADGETARLAGFVQGDETHLDLFPILEFVGDALDDFFAGFLRRHAAANLLDDHSAARVFDHGFAPTCSGSGSDVIVDVQARPDDGRVAHATVQFHAGSAGRAATGEIAIRVASDEPDGIVILDVDFLKLFGVDFGPLLLPGGKRRFGKQHLLLEALLDGELQSAVSYEHNVFRVFHYLPGDGNGILDMLEEGDRSAALTVIHDAGVERDMAVDVGHATDSNGAIVGVILDDVDAFFHGIEQAASVVEGFVSPLIGLQSEIPGRENNGSIDSLVLTERFERFETGQRSEG